MAAETQVLIAVGLVILGLFIGVEINGSYAKLLSDEILPSIRTIVSAFLGAWAAFSLQNHRNARESLDKKIGALNRAVFALSRQYSKMRNIDTQIIQPNRDHPAAFLQMPATHELEKDDIQIDFDSLSFILETSSRSIMEQVAIADASYRSALDALNSRSRLLLSEFQPLVEKNRILPGHVFDEAQMEKILGIRLYISLKQLGEQLIQSTSRALEQIEAASSRLSEFGKENLEKDRVIVVRPIEDEHKT